jgi:hypothetical protein
MNTWKKALLIAIPILAVLGISGYVYGLSSSSIRFISGTEYQVGESGQVIVRMVDAYGNGVTATWCNATIYYPDKTTMVSNVAMTQGGATGSWYYNFTAGTQIGVYEEQVTCLAVSPAKEIGAGSSFHVSQTLTMVNETSSARAVIVS